MDAMLSATVLLLLVAAGRGCSGQHTTNSSVDAKQLAVHMDVLEDEWRWWSFLTCFDKNDTARCLVRYLNGTSSHRSGRGEDDGSSPALGNPMMLLMMLRSKFGMLLMKMSLALQIKLLFISLASLLVNVYRVFVMKKEPERPQKVVHYQVTKHLHGGGHKTSSHHRERDTGWMAEYWRNAIKDHQGGLPPTLHDSFFFNNPHVPLDKRDQQSPDLPFLEPAPFID